MSRAFFDEMYAADGVCRPHYQGFARWLADTPLELLDQRRREADLLFHAPVSPSPCTVTSRAPSA